MIPRKIRIALVGLGRIGRTHLDAIRLNSDHAQLVAIVDTNEALLNSAAKELNVLTYTSLEKALSKAGIEAAVICLPHHLHKPVACQLMEAGSHVLVEKPLAANLQDASEMVEKARDKGVVLMVGQSHRYQWAHAEAKKRIMRGEIGDPMSILSTHCVYFDKSIAPTWWQAIKKTGGLIYTLVGPHVVDFALWIYEGKKPTLVYSEAQSLNPDFEGMDETLITIRFDDGAMATSYLSFNTKPSKREALIVGKKGSINIVLASDKLLGVSSADLFVNGRLVQRSGEEPHQFALQMREFLEAISKQRQPMVKNADILAQLAILDAAQKSAAIHQPVLL